jgi:rubrerythrin
MTIIKSGDEMANILRKALEIEMGFESVCQWEGYLKVGKNELKDTLYQMISESEQHKLMVENMLGKIKTSSNIQAFPIRPMTCNFNGKMDIEVMSEVLKIETMMKETYARIKETVVCSDCTSFINPDDVPFFVNTLSILIQQEGEHEMLARRHAGAIQRIK